MDATYNTERNWAKIALEKKGEIVTGLVYIGVGSYERPLDEIFAEDRIYLVVNGRFNNCALGYSGNRPSMHYAVPVDEWEKVTGLKYDEIIAPNWAERAKRTGYALPAGFVDIGTGSKALPLSDFFGGQHNIYKKGAYNSRYRDPNVRRSAMGTKENRNYAVTVDVWEKYTGLNYKEAMKEEKTPKNTERDWAALAREKIKEGFVYIGVGQKKGLKYIFDGVIYSTYDRVGALDRGGNVGAYDDLDYYVEISLWEKVTGLNYQETIKETETKEKTMKKIRTSNVNGMARLAAGIAKNKLIKTVRDTIPYENSGGFIFYNPNTSVSGSNLFGFSDSGPWDSFEMVSAGEFITALESLPDKPKILKIKIGSAEAEISADKIKVGCQEYTATEIQTIKSQVAKYRKSETLRFSDKKDIIISESGLTCDGTRITFEELDLLVKNFEEIS